MIHGWIVHAWLTEHRTCSCASGAAMPRYGPWGPCAYAPSPPATTTHETASGSLNKSAPTSRTWSWPECSSRRGRSPGCLRQHLYNIVPHLSIRLNRVRNIARHVYRSSHVGSEAYNCKITVKLPHPCRKCGEEVDISQANGAAPAPRPFWCGSTNDVPAPR